MFKKTKVVKPKDCAANGGTYETEPLTGVVVDSATSKAGTGKDDLLSEIGGL
jgi:hypothetical protein